MSSISFDTTHRVIHVPSSNTVEPLPASTLKKGTSYFPPRPNQPPPNPTSILTSHLGSLDSFPNASFNEKKPKMPLLTLEKPLLGNPSLASNPSFRGLPTPASTQGNLGSLKYSVNLGVTTQFNASPEGSVRAEPSSPLSATTKGLPKHIARTDVAPYRHALRRFAIIIGIDATTADRAVRIEHGSIDALRLAAFLRTCGFSLKCLTNATATRKGILEEMAKLTNDTREGDVVLVLYCGMGVKNAAGRRCWLVGDSCLSVEASYLPQKEVSAHLLKLRSTQVVLLVSAAPVEPVVAEAKDVDSGSMHGYASVTVFKPTPTVMHLRCVPVTSLWMIQGLFGQADIAPTGDITADGLMCFLADQFHEDHFESEPALIPHEHTHLYRYDVKKGEGLTPTVSVRIVIWVDYAVFDTITAASGTAVTDFLTEVSREHPDVMKSLMKPSVSAARRRRERFVFLLQQKQSGDTGPQSTLLGGLFPVLALPPVTSDTDDDQGDGQSELASYPFARQVNEREKHRIKTLTTSIMEYSNGAEVERLIFDRDTLAIQFTCNLGGSPHMAINDISAPLADLYTINVRYALDIEAEMVPKSFYVLDAMLRQRKWSKPNEPIARLIPFSVVLAGASHPTERVAFQTAPVRKKEVPGSVVSGADGDAISRFHNVAEMLRPTREEFVHEADHVFLCTNRQTTCLQVGFIGDKSYPMLEQLSEQCIVNYEQCAFRITKAIGEDQYSTTSEGREAIHFGQQIRILNVFKEQYLGLIEDDGLLAYDLGTTALKLAFLYPPPVNATDDVVAAFVSATTFFVHTRYKLREEGDIVRFGDHIVLSHVVSGKLIAMSNAPLWYLEPLKQFALVSQPEGSTGAHGWIVLPYYRAPATADTHGTELDITPVGSVYVKSGSVVSMYHIQEMGFLTASYTPNGSENVYFDCSNKGGEISMDDSIFTKFSSNAMWVIEYEKPYIGGVVEWAHQNKLYRIRHFATGMYLSCESRVNEDNDREFELILTRDFTKPSTLIALHAVLQGPDSETGLTDTKQVRIEFVRVQVWLHCSNLPATTTDVNFGQQYKVAISPRPVYEAVFAIKPASFAQRERLSSVIHMTSVIPRYINIDFAVELRRRGGNRGAASVFTCLTNDMKKVLELFIGFTSIQGAVPNPVLLRNSQTLLFAQNVHLLVFRMLQAPFRHVLVRELPDPDNRALVEVTTLGLKLIRNMIRDAHDLAFRLMTYIPFIETLLPYRVQAVDTLVELYRDNVALQQRLTESTIRAYLQPIPYLDVLSSCCLCGPSGVTRNQNFVGHLLNEYDSKTFIIYPRVFYRSHLLIRHSHAGANNTMGETARALVPPCVIRRADDRNFDDAADGDVAIEQLKAKRWKKPPGEDSEDASEKREALPSSSPWVTLQEFVASADTECIRHFENTLRLLARVCKGGNATARSMVGKYVSMDEVLVGIEMEHERDLGNSIRSAYLEVAVNVIVGEKAYDPLHDTSPASLTSFASDVVKNQTKLSGIMRHRPQSLREEFVRKLKSILYSIMSKNERQNDKEITRNVLLSQCVQCVKLLVHLGFYTKAELLVLVPILLRLLDPSSDTYSGETGVETLSVRPAEMKRPSDLNTMSSMSNQRYIRPRNTQIIGSAIGPSKHHDWKKVLTTKQELVKLLSRLATDYFSFSSYKADVYQTPEMREISVTLAVNTRCSMTSRRSTSLVTLTGQDAYIQILKRTTMYRGPYELYHFSVRLMLRAMGTIDHPVVSENERAIECLSKIVRDELIEGDTVFAVNLFRQWKEVRDDDLSIALLKVFTRVLECDDGQTQMQHILDTLGMTSLVCVLAESTHETVSLCALECGIALLHGGNKKIQKSLVHYFISRSDEALFMAFNMRFRSATRQVNAMEHRIREENHIDDRTIRRGYDGPVIPFEQNNLFNMRQVLRFLQLFCEGHNSELQNYLREQPDNVHTYNLVRESISFIRVLLSISCATNFTMDVLLQAFNTLTEYCQGPVPKNQLTLVHANIGYEVTRVFENEYDSCVVDSDMVDNVRSAAVTTLLSLLEGCADKRIPQMLFNTVKFDILQGELEKIVQVTELAETEENEGPLSLGFNIFILVKTLESYFQSEMASFVRNLPGVLFFTSLTGRIEILRAGNIERIYFRIPTICRNLSDVSKYHILWSVNRDTPTLRIADFFARAEEVIYEIEFVERFKMEKRIESFMDIFNRFKVWNTLNFWIFNSADQWHRAFYHYTLVANFLLLVGCGSSLAMTAERTHILDGIAMEEGFGPIIFWVSIVMSLLVLIQCQILVLVRAPIGEFRIERLRLRALARRNKATSQSTMVTDTAHVVQTTWSHLMFALTMKDFRYHCLIFLACIMSAFVSPFFLWFPLLSIIGNNDVLLNVIRSVTQNGQSLMMTVMLGLIITYFFSIVGFILFREQFQDKDDGEYQCDTLLHCFVFISTQGTRQGGGVGDAMQPLNWNHKHHGLRTTFDLVFFILVIVILMNIVFGIIIDTFAELRSKKQKIEDDIHTRCFICGLESSAFDRNAEGFDHHIHNDHNMWWYIYFLHYLQKKEDSEFTGQESYVHDMIRAHDMSFFPLSRALCLDGRIGDDDDESFAHMQKIHTGIEALDVRLAELSESVSTEAADVRVNITETVTALQKDVRELVDAMTAARLVPKK